MTELLTLYTRAGCSLCDEMVCAVEALAGGRGFRCVDVDTDPELKSRFGWDVPLLFHGETEIARHRLDPAAFRAWLAGNV